MPGESDGTIPATRGMYFVGQQGTPGQGPFMTVILHVTDNKVDDARYQTYNCPAAEACGEFVAAWVLGKTIEEASMLTDRIITDAIGSMPLGREHCTGLAVNAIRSVRTAPIGTD